MTALTSIGIAVRPAALAGALALAFSAALASAQDLPPSGEFSITFTSVNPNPSKILSIGNKDVIVSQGIMTAYNDAGSGLLHLLAGRCSLMATIDKTAKTIENRGACVYTDRAGDQVFEEFATVSPQPLGPVVAFKGKWNGGTGKYAGLAGEFDIRSSSVLSTETLTQTAGKKIGKYTIGPATAQK